MELLPGSVSWEVTGNKTKEKKKGNSLGPEKTFSLIATVGREVILQRQSLGILPKATGSWRSRWSHNWSHSVEKLHSTFVTP